MGRFGLDPELQMQPLDHKEGNIHTMLLEHLQASDFEKISIFKFQSYMISVKDLSRSIQLRIR